MQTDDLLRLNGESFVLHGRAEYRAGPRKSLLAGAEEDGYVFSNLAGIPNRKRVIERLGSLVRTRLAANPTLAPWDGDWKLYVVTDPGHTSIDHFGQSFRDELACIMRLTPVTGVAVVTECEMQYSCFAALRHVEASWRDHLRATD